MSTIKLGKNVEIEILESADKEFLGIGAVAIDGVQLRSTERPFVVRLDTPDGILYTRLTIEEIDTTDDKAVVKMIAHGFPWSRGEYLDECTQTMITTDLPVDGCDDQLDLVLEVGELQLDGKEFVGFSYSFKFKSEKRKVHRFLTHATWEINGSITGNTVLNQGQCNMPVYYGSREDLFTTGCLKTLDQYGSMQGYSYQLGPRAGLHQGFDFQYSDAGILFQYWPDYKSVSSLVESPNGVDILHVIDEYRQELDHQMKTTPKQVVFCKGDFPKHECRNVWWHAYKLTYGGIKERFGISPTIVMPEFGINYDTSLKYDSFKMIIHGEEYPPEELLYAIGDKVLPAFAEAGIKRFFPICASQSDVSELGMKRKLEDGIHGDLHCASVCATHRFFPADFWGGIKAWRYMADKARSLGIEVGSWFAPHFSPKAAIFKEHPDWLVADVNGLRSGSGYGIHTICTADWNTGVYKWALDDITRWQEEGGLDYLFTDSFVNLGLLQQNYREGMRTNYEAMGRLYHDFQKIGIKCFSFESVSPFGVSRFGLRDMRGDLLDALGGVVGQNDFGWWINEEDMAFNVCMCVEPRKRTDEELKNIQFQAMANRGHVMYDDKFDHCHKIPEWYSELNHIYTQAVGDMQERSLLADNQGVSWQNSDTTIIWAFKKKKLDLDSGKSVEIIRKSGPEKLDTTSSLITEPGTVYRISKK